LQRIPGVQQPSTAERHSTNRVSVVGAGAWGTALGLAAARAGRSVLLWAREPEVVAAVNDRRENAAFLPGVVLEDGIRATADLAEAAKADAVLLVVPAQHLRAAAAALAPHLAPGTPIVLCAKGIERGSLKLMSEILAEIGGDWIPAILSGPSFAVDVARGLPTAVTLAVADWDLGQDLVGAIGARSFRPYWSPDVVGAQIGGAVKNVIAIACGIAIGLGLGESARAALMTRGFAEMTRLGRALGARPETLMGLSGLGDLALTCASAQSRNFSFGAALGAGRAVQDALASHGTVEGAATAVAVTELAARKGTDMPISASVGRIVQGAASIEDSIEALLTRPFRGEAE
jgi:glycerol-3-phosphate dehydrogenase (NAD(P)+)